MMTLSHITMFSQTTRLFHAQRRDMFPYKFPVCAHKSFDSNGGRRTANYLPSQWCDDFLGSLTYNPQEYDLRRVNKLKEDVRHMINMKETLETKIELINAIQQLGVAYHFKNEIKLALHEIFDSQVLQNLNDIYVSSLLFRLLRMHGFNVSDDIFDHYKDKNGNFETYLCNNVEGMLRLYEACHLTKAGDNTLESAADFSHKNLKDFLQNSHGQDTMLRRDVEYAMEVPLRWRATRLHAHWYIAACQKEKTVKPLLLELAVLDFNLVQHMHNRELKELYSWWSGLGLSDRLPFMRDRHVENYIISLVALPEPNYASIRKAQTKVNSLITAMDDIYDVYGSLHELELLTDAIQRWDVTASRKLPDYMKLPFLAVFNTANEMCYEVMKEKGLDISPFIIKGWANHCKAYFVEAKWYNEGYVPTLEEYLENAWISIGGPLSLVGIYCLNPHITSGDLEAFALCADQIRYASAICRIVNDLGTSTPEQKRGDILKSVQCCMHEKGVTEGEAREEMKKIVRQYWKKLNGEKIGDSDFHECFRNAVLDGTRTVQWLYEHGDGYGDPKRAGLVDTIKSALFEPIDM